jgi:hypothetical protein
MIKALCKLLVETIVKDTLSSTGTHLGEAIGKRIGSYIHSDGVQAPGSVPQGDKATGDGVPDGAPKDDVAT